MADKLFAAVIFDPSLTEGIEGKLIVDTELDNIKAAVVYEVEALNRDLDEEDNPGDFDWSGLSFYPVASVEYGSFAWGRVYETYAGASLNFSEFGS